MRTTSLKANDIVVEKNFLKISKFDHTIPLKDIIVTSFQDPILNVDGYLVFKYFEINYYFAFSKKFSKQISDILEKIQIAQHNAA